MSKKKETVIPNSLTTEELLNQLENTETTNQESFVYSTDSKFGKIYEFLTFYNIKSGDFLVNISILYKIFKSWNKSEDYGKHYFVLQMQQLFEKQGPYVLINVEALDLTIKAKTVFFVSERSEKVSSKFYKKHMDSFIEKYGLVPGKYAVKSTMLYYIYQIWTTETKKRVLKFVDFTHILTQYFTGHKQSDKYSTYKFYIDKDSLRIEGELLEKAKKRTKSNRKKKKAN